MIHRRRSLGAGPTKVKEQIANDASVTDSLHNCYKRQLASTQTTFHGNDNEFY
jgi:hypothetical protein